MNKPITTPTASAIVICRSRVGHLAHKPHCDRIVPERIMNALGAEAIATLAPDLAPCARCNPVFEVTLSNPDTDPLTETRRTPPQTGSPYLTLKTARNEQLEAAKTEAAAVKEAARTGDPRPPTPNLDALSARTTDHTSRDGVRAAPKSKIERGPTPKVKAGVALPLRSEKTAEVVDRALALADLHSDTVWISGTGTTGLWLIITNQAAQAVATAVATHATANSKVIYDARLLVATLVSIRQAFPKVSVVKGGAIMQLVDLLNAQERDWDATTRTDGTLIWSLDGETFGARELLHYLTATAA